MGIIMRVIFLLIIGGLTACKNDSSSVVDDNVESSFTKPRTIVVSLSPYDSIDEALDNIERVDWSDEEGVEATAITKAYAAQELIEHLALLDIAVEVIEPADMAGHNNIILTVNNDINAKSIENTKFEELGEQGYSIDTHEGNLYVSGYKRVGLLYGVYGLLEKLGFNWFDELSIDIPNSWDSSQLAKNEFKVPSSTLRGFWVYGESELTSGYVKWMARNRLNLAANVPYGLKQLLGMKEWGGEHNLLQQEFSSEELFEKNPSWYSVINDVRRPVAKTGNYFNPSFASVEGANYFAERMIERLSTGDLKNIDILNIWPADSRANRFDQSDAALEVGNETDNLLHFYTILAKRFAEAHLNGRLNRNVLLAGISYYTTWMPPTNIDVIGDLKEYDYVHIFYLNERTWSKNIFDNEDNQSANSIIVENLNSWKNVADFNFGIVEYYNYSVYSALTLTDHFRFAENFSYLSDYRDNLIAYMHPLKTNPGPKRITNALMSSLTWVDNLNEAEFKSYSENKKQTYFRARYGQNAEKWNEIYELMESSVDNSKEMFAHNSLSWLLFKNVIWGLEFDQSDIGTIQQYRAGGNLKLPDVFRTDDITLNFRGLDDSLSLQSKAKDIWENVELNGVSNSVRNNIISDIVWFKATYFRYILMEKTCQYIVARINGVDTSVLRSEILEAIKFLENSPVTSDTISPVNQRAFLSNHKAIINE